MLRCDGSAPREALVKPLWTMVELPAGDVAAETTGGERGDGDLCMLWKSVPDSLARALGWGAWVAEMLM